MTNTNQHTPGPWAVAAYTDGHDKPYYIINNFKLALDEAENGYDIHQNNARLIAAAPELLDAIENLIGWYDAKDGDFLLKDQLIKDCNTAIAKARG